MLVPEKVCVCVYMCMYIVFCPKFTTSPMRPEEALYLICCPADAHFQLQGDRNVQHDFIFLSFCYMEVILKETV